MRIRIFAIAAAAIAFTAPAAPAHAGDLETVVDVVSNVIGVVETRNVDFCNLNRGLTRTTCKVRRAQREIEHTRRLAQPLFERSDDQPSRPSARRAQSQRMTTLQHCSAGSQIACDQLDMAPQQAAYVLSRIG